MDNRELHDLLLRAAGTVEYPQGLSREEKKELADQLMDAANAFRGSFEGDQYGVTRENNDADPHERTEWVDWMLQQPGASVPGRGKTTTLKQPKATIDCYEIKDYHCLWAGHQAKGMHVVVYDTDVEENTPSPSSCTRFF